MPREQGDRSPYELALGDSVSELSPGLRAYFRGIPTGWVGVGTGTFRVVGTPRRWLWPVLWILERQGVLFPVWEHGVAFTVVNRPRVTEGKVAVTAVRTFKTTGRARRMVDAITADGANIVDDLGLRRRYRARFAVSVAAGALELSSIGVAVRIRNRWLAVPRWVAPAVRLTERFDEQEKLQHVAVVTTIPGLGRVYEYAGSFEYELRQAGGASDWTSRNE